MSCDMVDTLISSGLLLTESQKHRQEDLNAHHSTLIGSSSWSSRNAAQMDGMAHIETRVLVKQR